MDHIGFFYLTIAAPATPGIAALAVACCTANSLKSHVVSAFAQQLSMAHTSRHDKPSKAARKAGRRVDLTRLTVEDIVEAFEEMEAGR